MKDRYDHENLFWIPILIIFVFLLPVILKGASFSYKYYLFVLNSLKIQMKLENELNGIFHSIT